LVQLLLLVQVTCERIKLLAPESLVARHPRGGLLQRRRRKLAAYDPAFLGPRDQAGILQHVQMFHETGKRHVVRGRKLADRQAVAAQRLEDVAPRAIGQRGKQRIELVF
jgi:hypothetical protein